MRLFGKDRDLNEVPEEVDLVVEASTLGQPAAEVYIRLDHYLRRFLTWRSRTSIQVLIRDGYVAIDPSSPEHPLGSGEFMIERRPGRRLLHKSRIRITIPEVNRLELSRPTAEDIVVLYEDAAVVCVDKPAFMTVHPSGRHMSGTLIQKVYELYPRVTDREARPRLCHRLDRETSGLVLIGKHIEAHADCMRQFERREVEKTYLAIVEGVPELGSGVIELPLGSSRSSSIGLKMAVRSDGLPSRTSWEVREEYASCALVACRPHTGRQHQIRVHLDALGHPIVGDKLYGPDESIFPRALENALSSRDIELLRLPRHALHNHRLTFTSPATGERTTVESPLARDLRGFLDAQL